MKQVEYASIGGYVFSFEDNASLAAKEYLDQLEAFYSGKESGSEVMEGIEERMAELLIERSGRGGVVTLAVVNDVVSVLGRPEVIEEESAGASAGGTAGTSENPAGKQSGAVPKPRRRLYRDPANGKLAGVCSGLATYLNVDTALFRIAFVLLSLLFLCFVPFSPFCLFPLMAYIVLWICMPAVKTVRQRDELRGEGGTVDDISARVRSTSRDDAKPKDSQTWKNVGRVLSVVVGAVLLLAGVAGVAFLCSFCWGGEILGNSFFYNKFIEELSIETPPEVMAFITAPLVVLAAVLVAAIPLFIMIYAGVMLIFGLKSPKWHPGLILFVIWLVILVALFVSTFITLAVMM